MTIITKPKKEQEEDPVVCICLNLKESDFQTAIRKGAYDMETLMAETGGGTRCTACWIDMSDILLENLPTEASKQVSTPEIYTSRYPRHLLSRSQKLKNAVKRLLRRPNVIYATFGIEREDLHTRINVFNVDHPEGHFNTSDYWFRIICYSYDGKRLNHKDFTLKRNGALSIKLADLLEDLGIPIPYLGLLKIDTDISTVGSTRCYMHWYNAKSITSTHEKYSTSPIQWGFTTLVRVLEHEPYETYLAVTNLTSKIHHDAAHLRLADGRELGIRKFSLKPSASLFFRVIDWFDDAKEELKKQDASLYFEGISPSLMTYYFTFNKREDVWFAQHL